MEGVCSMEEVSKQAGIVACIRVGYKAHGVDRKEEGSLDLCLPSLTEGTRHRGLTISLNLNMKCVAKMPIDIAIIAV